LFVFFVAVAVAIRCMLLLLLLCIDVLDLIIIIVWMLWMQREKSNLKYTHLVLLTAKLVCLWNLSLRCYGRLNTL